MGYRMLNREKRRELLEAELKRAVDVLKKRGVEKIILFGSFGRGEIGARSDIDLIVVEKTEKPFLERLDELYRVIVPRVSMDILVYTPEELEELEKRSSFVRQALREGRILYAKESC
ncbi:MAG: nucleotidyltransferase domain-containing protein [Candidatus Caldatribacterium sp.]|nr:nucleotidyltransferase domain-containing protein [Candidatus Caldatribacterium sp.]